jgi:molybdopterin-guanine dinucleotide biosynthesis protein B
MHELLGEPEATFEQIVSLVGACDLIVVEGYKRELFPKLEIRRDAAASRKALTSAIPQVVAIASDHPEKETDDLPIFHLDDVDNIADFVINYLGIPSP